MTTEADSSTALVEVRALGKTYGAAVALRDVSFSIKAGEIICLVGENGAGKSTLAGLLAGLVRPSSGQILINGTAATFDSPRDAFMAGIRIAPQELLLCPNLTVSENISLGHLPTRRGGVVNTPAERRVAYARLSSLGISDLPLNERVADLTVVNQALVQIARAMSPGAKVLITDEPTSTMSDAESTRLLTLLREIAAGGVAVVYISHRTDEVVRIGARVLVLRDGGLRDEIKREDLSRERLIEAMLGGNRLADSASAIQPGRARLVANSLAGQSIRGMSFSAHAGEILGVYGISGSGREELGPLLFGASRRLSGDVTIDGRRLKADSPRESMRLGMGYVPPERRSQGLVMSDSVRRNLSLGNLNLVSKHGTIIKRRERALAVRWWKALNLKAPSVESPVDRLSGGTQQKVLLARWLIRSPAVLVLDEPTRGVDIATKQEIYGRLRAVANSGTAIVVISSDVEEVAAVSDRVAVLVRGRVVATAHRPSEADILNLAIRSRVAAE